MSLQISMCFVAKLRGGDLRTIELAGSIVSSYVPVRGCSFDRVADEPRERPTDPLKSRPLLVVPRYRTTVGSTQHQGQQPARSTQHPAAEPSVHAHATRTQPSHAHFRDLVRPAHSGGGARRLLSLCAHYSVSTAGTTYQISIT